MALRLRRGTDAERQTITPLEGELIYTTDTEKLYVGDGTTVGGNPIDSDTITDTLSDLTDVNTAGIQDGQTLAYNLSNTQFEPATLATTINNLTDVDTTGVSTGDVLKWDGASFVVAAEGAITEGATYNINISGNVDGDVTGSVFADDSTLVIDGLTGDVSSTNIVGTNLTLDYDSIDYGNIIFSYDGTPGGGPLSRIRVENNLTQVFSMQTRLTNTFITQTSDASTGITLYSDDIVFDGLNVGIKQYNPTADLDINGVMRLRPQSAAPGTPVDGMIAAADGTNWDPASKSGTDSYPVYYDGSTWNALY